MVSNNVFRYSSLSAAQFCPTLYKLQYIDKIERPTKSGDMFFGTSVHLALNAYFEGDDPISQFNLIWNSIENDAYEFGRFDWHALKAMGLVFIERFVERHAKKYEAFKVEDKLACNINGFNVEGTADFIGLYEGKRSIVDFKTSYSPYDKKKLLSSEQLTLYAIMAHALYGYEIEQIVYVVFVKSTTRIQVLTLDITSQTLHDTLTNVTLMMKDLDSRTQFQKNKINCPKCAYFNTCYGVTEL